MKFKMIDTIDDLLTLKEEDEYKPILKDNGLNKFIFGLKEACLSFTESLLMKLTNHLIMKLMLRYWMNAGQ